MLHPHSCVYVRTYNPCDTTKNPQFPRDKSLPSAPSKWTATERYQQIRYDIGTYVRMYTDDTQMHKPYVCMYRRTLSFSLSISTTLSSLVFSTRRAFTASMDSCKGGAWVSELFLNIYWPHANQELSKIRPLSTHAPSAYIRT